MSTNRAEENSTNPRSAQEFTAEYKPLNGNGIETYDAYTYGRGVLAMRKAIEGDLKRAIMTSAYDMAGLTVDERDGEREKRKLTAETKHG